MPAVSHSCSFIRFLRGPDPTLTILEENSTPIVCDERTCPDQVGLQSACRSHIAGWGKGSRTFILDETVQYAGSKQRGSSVWHVQDAPVSAFGEER